jgi:lactaldehyde dehydrogenase/glycolaldehyde dehydrogenase
MTDFGRVWIDGAWVAGEAGPRQVLNPTTGRPLAEVSDASVAQAGEAIEAALRAQPAWGARSPLDRGRVMHRIAALIREHAEPLARLVVEEQGKPIAEARGEIGGAAEFFTYFAEFARRIQGEIFPSDAAGEQIWIQRVPVGVVSAIIPWNYPAALVSRKVAPALIAGNAIVLKPHEETPLSAPFHGAPDGGGRACRPASSASSPGPALRWARRSPRTRGWTSSP